MVAQILDMPYILWSFRISSFSFLSFLRSCVSPLQYQMFFWVFSVSEKNGRPKAAIHLICYYSDQLRK